MKRSEIAFIIIILFGVLISFITESEGNKSSFYYLIVFIIFASYLLGGYFIFKPTIKINSWKLFAILNGMVISVGLFFVMGKIAVPNQTHLIPLAFLIPLLLTTIYSAIKALLKSSTETEKSYFKNIVRRNFIVLVILLSIILSPGDIFSKVLFGSTSRKYYTTLQENYLYDSYEFSRNNEFKQALGSIETAIKYSELKHDNNSQLFLECMNELGYIYYRLDEYNKCDSTLTFVLDYFNGQDAESIKSQFKRDIKEIYFDAIFTKALLSSTLSEYNKSDSLFYISLKYYENDIKLAYINSKLGYNQQKSGNYQKADSLYLISLRYHENVNYENKSQYLSTLLDYSQNKIESSNFKSADSILNISYLFAKKEFGVTNIETADVLDKYIILNITLANYSKAKKYCLESLNIKKKTLGINNVDYLYTKLDLLSIYLATSEFKDFNGLLFETQKTIENEFDNRSPIACTLYDILFEYYEDIMNFNLAYSYAEKSLEGRIYWKGKYHINTANSYHNLASVNYYQSNYVTSDSLYTLALKIKRYFKGTQTLSYASSVNGLALVYIEKDSLELANRYLEYCLNIVDKNLGKENPEYGTILKNVAYLNIKKGNFDLANSELLNALSIYNKNFNNKHLKIGNTFFTLGNLESKRNNNRLAILYYTKAIDIYIKILGNNHYFVKQIEATIENLENNLIEK